MMIKTLDKLFTKLFRAFLKFYKIILICVGLTWLVFGIAVTHYSKVRFGKGYANHLSIAKYSICPNTIPYPSVISPNGKKWIGNDRTYFFSAYYDYRENVTIVFGMLEVGTHDLYCLSWYSNNATVEVEKVSLLVIPDSHRPRYFEAIVKCPHTGKSLPTAVSIINNSCKPIVTFNINYYKVENKTEIHWCLSPIHAGRSIQFLEALVLHKLIGITKATIYSENQEVSQQLKKFDWITIIEWEVPMKDNEVQYHGQRSALNDCLYRNMFSARFIDFTDLDEIILPRRLNQTINYSNLLWKELNALQLSNRNRVAGFYFKSILFATARRIKSFASLTVTTKYDRSSDSRRKYIILPERVSHLTVHWVFAYSKFWVLCVDEIATLHHYRKCPNPRVNCCGRDNRRDSMSPDKFVLKLEDNIKQINRTLSANL
ncbi:DgyrCDS14019 [Dimorphilus gyrociliatus]|uniref:Glycosyltransferase family 92 protein n=1 Tax=Dimorphilus gyrociliatus TaxID=2664684 RepID=A0A7I8WCB4_9ANNE|nr:DgyrCDS14019 [Dimorphilus gyrociliatus]